MLPSVLILDDEIEILNALERLLHREYRVVTFTDPIEAIDYYQQSPTHIVISDIRMPKMNGGEFLKSIVAINSNSKRVALTGYADLELAKQVLNEGKVSFYLNKPWDNKDLVSKIDSLVGELKAENKKNKIIKKLRASNKELLLDHHSETLLKEFISDKHDDAVGQIKRLKRINNDLVSMNVNLIAVSTNEAPGHSLRIAQQAKIIARMCGLSDIDCIHVYLAGLFHRIGLASLTEELRNKALYELSPQERRDYDAFSVLSAEIMSSTDYLAGSLDLVKYLNENSNGSGVPEKLTKQNIPLGSRILRVTVLFDLMINGEFTGLRIAPSEAFVKLEQMSDEIDISVLEQLKVLVGKAQDTEVFEYPKLVNGLEAGMLVAQDIEDLEHHKYLSEGTVLKETHIMRLNNIQRQLDYPLVVFIKSMLESSGGA
ncbi:HD domain-containing phosphohydrolase [Thalassotalea atypica]|uniref:HD domain-containing phosphohydrolase n=1 Tax=Thalassotalea atypica TaxID=2054316 RepID=UPI0025738292|nr:HD domain-containing phosphohydrolase [Thalassotalea atypica]